MIKSSSNDLSTKKDMIFQGIKSSFPVAVSFFTVSATVGIYADYMQIPHLAAIFMSFLVFAGASQFSAIHRYAVGATSWEIILTTFIINIRSFLMATSLSRKIDQKMSLPFSSLLSFGVTDATFALIYFHKAQNFQPSYILGLNLFSHLSCILGTTFGVIFGKYLPDGIKDSIGIAIYALFISLLVPEIKKSNIGLKKLE